MNIFERLKNNKGTVSSSLGKELAAEVLNGKEGLLKEAVNLLNYNLNNKKDKNIRAVAAKILEKVAEEKPEMLAPYLEELLPALDAEEAQTRWMVLKTLGYCAQLNPELTSKAIPYARKFIKAKEGVCLSGAAEIYLGYIGSIKKEYAEKSFEILSEAAKDPLPNEIDWIFEGFLLILDQLDKQKRKIIIDFASKYQDKGKKSTQKRAKKIIKKLS